MSSTINGEVPPAAGTVMVAVAGPAPGSGAGGGSRPARPRRDGRQPVGRGASETFRSMVTSADQAGGKPDRGKPDRGKPDRG